MARFYTLKDYPCVECDNAGQLYLYDDGGIDENEGEAVVVVPEGSGWREVVGAEADLD